MFSLIKSGMATAMHELSVVSNNIANANSNGFKKTLVAFSELGDRFGSEQVDSAKVGQGASLGAHEEAMDKDQLSTLIIEPTWLCLVMVCLFSKTQIA